MLPVPVVELCESAAPFCSIAVFLAPIPTIHQIKRDRRVGDLPLLPYSSMILSGFLWTVYGKLKGEPSVWASNAIGLVLGLYYFYGFTKFAPKESSSSSSSSTLPGRVRHHKMVIWTTFIGTMLLYYSGSSLASRIIGFAAVALYLALSGSPLAAVRTVLRTKSAQAIPWPFTLASICSCFCWTVFGLFKMNDPNVYWTSAIGLTFGIMQAALKVIYGDGHRPVPLPI